MPRDALGRSRAFRSAAVFLLFAALAAVWLSPIVLDPGGTMLGEPSDGSGSLREYWAAGAQGESVFTWEHDALATAPEGLARSNAVAVANAITPLFMLVLEPVLGLVTAWNLFLLLGFALTGLITFRLLEQLDLDFAPALFGAYVLTFSTFTIEKAVFGQTSFVHVWVFPLLLLALLRVRERRDLASAGLAGLAVALAFYLQSYFGLLALLLVGVFMGVDIVLARRGDRLWSFTLLDAIFGVALAALSPVLLLWWRERDRVASVLSRPLEDLQALGASVSAYLVPSGRHPVLGDLGERSQQATSGEPTLFVGYTTLAFAAVGVVLLLRSRPPFEHGRQRFVAIVAAVLVPVAFLVSLPRELSVFGLDVPMPSYFLGEIVTYWRVYARFGVLVGLGLVLLAALALQAIGGGRRGSLVAAGALALVAFELSPGFGVESWDAATPPPHVRWLAEHPGGTVAYYPEPEESNAFLYLMNREYAYQRLHGHPLYNMWGGGWTGTRTEAIRILSRNPGDPLAPGILAAQRVRYAVALEGVDRGGASAPEFPASAYKQVASLPNARIFEVTAEPVDIGEVLESQRARVAQARALAAPALSYGDGFYEPEPWTDGREWRWLRQDGRLELDAAEPLQVTLSFSAFSAERPRTLRLLDDSGMVLGSAEVPPQQVEVTFPEVELPAGRTELTLRAEPDPEQLDETRVTSIYISPIAVQPLATYLER